MLPIPKELLGQKAIPFMEWYICYYSNYGGTMHVITDFYSQPFTPEMLQEYFEGFEYSDHFNRICYKYHNLLYLKEYTIGGNKCFDLRIDSFEKVNKDYLTLNLFISLCLNRDITLTWKGEK